MLITMQDREKARGQRAEGKLAGQLRQAQEEARAALEELVRAFSPITAICMYTRW